ncbi:hypothetical protein [Cloacibacterium normanense]
MDLPDCSVFLNLKLKSACSKSETPVCGLKIERLSADRSNYNANKQGLE